MRASIRAGRRRLLLVLPTGGGKTTIAAAMIRGTVDRGRKGMFLAHRRELISQCSNRLREHAILHGIVQADSPFRNAAAPVQVASVPTLVNRIAKRRYPADLIIVDEAHRSTAPSYLKVLEAYPDAIVVGLTATPYRADGKGLGGIYEELILAEHPDALVRDGFLIEPTIFAPGSPDTSKVKVKAGDYVPGELAEIMDRGSITGDIVEHWRRLVNGGRTVVFACTVEHSLHLRDRFREAGIPAAHIDAETPGPERDASLAKLRSGDIRVVTNVGIVTEGFDLPALEACVLARPTKSTGLYLQMVGRVLRPDPATGKTRALVLDHGNCVRDHGWPTAPREFSLDGPPRLVDKRGREITGLSVHVCRQCFASFARHIAACPQCGLATRAEQDVLQEADGELEEIRREQTPEPPPPISRLREAYRGLIIMARDRGWKIEAAKIRFKQQFKLWPHRGITHGIEELYYADRRDRSEGPAREASALAAEPS
jgi:superfamily II DNA or RNA helicase